MKSKLLTLGFCVLAALTDIAAPLDYYFMFETYGRDCYADGSPLMEKECYALIWRHNDITNQVDGLFYGDGTPVDPAKCELLWVFDSAVRDESSGSPVAYSARDYIGINPIHLSTKGKEGVYSLFVFDTRVRKGEAWELGGKTSYTSVAALNSYGIVTDLGTLTTLKTLPSEKGFFTWDTLRHGESFTNDDTKVSYGDESENYSCTDHPALFGLFANADGVAVYAVPDCQGRIVCTADVKGFAEGVFAKSSIRSLELESSALALPLNAFVKGTTANFGVDIAVKSAGALSPVVAFVGSDSKVYQTLSDAYAAGCASVTATVEMPTYTVTYKANGGTGADVKESVTFFTPYTISANPFTRKYYGFEGWSVTADAAAVYHPGDVVSNLSATVGGDAPFFAQWFRLPGPFVSAEGVVTNAIPNAQGTVVISNAYDGVKVVGCAPGALVHPDLAKVILENVELPLNPAAFVGTEGSIQEVEISLLVNGRSVPAVAFVGSDNKVYQTIAAAYAAGCTAVTAVVEMPAYTVTYKANGGMGADVKESVAFFTPYTIAANPFSRQFHRFAGWKASAKTYQPGVIVSNLAETVGGNAALLAQWDDLRGPQVNAKGIVTNAVADADGTVVVSNVCKGVTVVGCAPGAFAGADVTKVVFENAALAINPAAFLGSGRVGPAAQVALLIAGKAVSAVAFVGVDDGYVYQTLAGAYAAGCTAVTAKTEVPIYTVTYRPNGGAGENVTETIAFFATYAIAANPFSRQYFRFDGWATEAGGKAVYQPDAIVSNLSATAGGDIPLFACWTALPGPQVNSKGVVTNAVADAGGTVVVSNVCEGVTVTGCAPGAFAGADIKKVVFENAALEFDPAAFIGQARSNLDAQIALLVAGETKPAVAFVGSDGKVHKTLADAYAAGCTAVTSAVEMPTYTVTYKPNGGEGEDVTAMYAFFETFTIAANPFERAGYRFVEWAAPTATYRPGDAVSNLAATVEGNAILLARWINLKGPQVNADGMITNAVPEADGTVIVSNICEGVTVVGYAPGAFAGEDIKKVVFENAALDLDPTAFIGSTRSNLGAQIALLVAGETKPAVAFVGSDGKVYKTLAAAYEAGCASVRVSPVPVPTYKLSVKSVSTKRGKVSGSGSYVSGAYVKLTAKPSSGYVFAGWFTDKSCKKALKPKDYDNREKSVMYAMPAKTMTVYANFITKTADKTALKFKSSAVKLAKTPAKVTAGASGSVKVSFASSSLPTVTATGLPSGMEIDKRTGEVTGKPTKPGSYTATVTVKSAAGNKIKQKVKIDVNVPSGYSGTFDGYALVGKTPAYVTFTVKSIGSISGKVTYKGKGYSFTSSYSSASSTKAKFTPKIKIGKTTYKPPVYVQKVKDGLTLVEAQGEVSGFSLGAQKKTGLIKSGKAIAGLVGKTLKVTNAKYASAKLPKSSDYLTLKFAATDAVTVSGKLKGKAVSIKTSVLIRGKSVDSKARDLYPAEIVIIDKPSGYSCLMALNIVVSGSGKASIPSSSLKFSSIGK